MKKGFLATSLLIALVAGTLLFASTVDESRIIRRAYLDVLGTVPTITEIEWYCVYNKNNSYRLAVEYLISRPGVGLKGICDKDELRKTLLSKEYREAKREQLTIKKVHEMVMYQSGLRGEASLENVLQAKIRLIENAMSDESTDSDVIDHMALQLMSRTTTMEEANMLLASLRAFRKGVSEETAWVKTLDRLLVLDDVASK
jgi:hypothetical protein